MSRHRNVKHMIQEDCYYDDDDYDDDDDDDYYDEYDTSYATPKPKAKQAANSKTKTPAAATKTKTAATATRAASPKKPASATGGSGISPLSPVKTAPAAAAAANTSSPATTTLTGMTRVTPAILLQQQEGTKQNQRTPLTVVVLGHVDAGKSTITGHLLYHYEQHKNRNNSTDTNAPMSPTTRPAAIRKPTSSSPYHNNNNTKQINYAWLLDEDEDERAHGVTMDVATKLLSTATKFDIVLQDAPGHADFVPAMITGTASADAAMLTVDATDFGTAFHSGQLKEHAVLARGLGVQQILVVVNKMDLVEWNREAYDSIVAQLTAFLVQRIGFGAKKVRFVPVSGVHGTNVFWAPKTATATSSDNDDGAAAASWYTGPTLWQALDGFDIPLHQSQGKLLEKPARILITDVLADQGKGVAVRCKVLQGWIEAGESLVVNPIGDATTLTKLQTFSRTGAAATSSSVASGSSDRAQYAAVGEVVDAVVTGVDITRLSTGNIVTRPDQRPPLATKCRAKVWILERLNIPIIRGGQAIFHMHHLDIPCNVSGLIRTLQKDGTTTAKERPRALTANTQAEVELTLLTPICMEAFADCRSLGRFVLRRGGDSIAVGRIEHIII